MNDTNKIQDKTRCEVHAGNDVTLRLFSLRTSVIATIVLAVIVCGIYSAIVWGLETAGVRHQANGSINRQG